MKFPKPWKLERSDYASGFVVNDANGRKLFYICSDDYPDGKGFPGDAEGPTIFDYGDDEDLINEIEEMLGRLDP